ncbi:MAG: putative toxin-antitoxin system toxin component, PIN family [Actinomycetota bacterium]|nr:putative toxin-antitoxin system toxin component, PIN family [Actinomycetota bacterium]
MKGVLDPNVLVSSLFSREGTGKILLEWLHGAFDLVVSPALLNELEKTLRYPKIRKRVTEEDSENFITLLRLSGIFVDDPSDPPAVRSRDPKDDYILALAASQSAVIVTGDKDLLDLEGSLPIYSPTQFLDLLMH